MSCAAVRFAPQSVPASGTGGRGSTSASTDGRSGEAARSPPEAMTSETTEVEHSSGQEVRRRNHIKYPNLLLLLAPTKTTQKPAHPATTCPSTVCPHATRLLSDDVLDELAKDQRHVQHTPLAVMEIQYLDLCKCLPSSPRDGLPRSAPVKPSSDLTPCSANSAHGQASPASRPRWRLLGSGTRRRESVRLVSRLRRTGWRWRRCCSRSRTSKDLSSPAGLPRSPGRMSSLLSEAVDLLFFPRCLRAAKTLCPVPPTFAGS